MIFKIGAHIYYLRMTGLLMIFFLLFRHFRTPPRLIIVFSMCTGSIMNPLGFLLLAMKPNLSQHPASPFGMVMAFSFTLTTIGYLGAAWSMGYAGILSL